MITRRALTELERWYSSTSRKPLVLRGARQVGKSTLVREFASKAGLTLWEVNLEKNRKLDKVFESFDLRLILQELSLALNTANTGKGSGILFLDEIQECPQGTRVSSLLP